ncbi:hypothetical protein DFH09DRAFT_1369154 [Mycena vulgaris]|nr:hypothetical protein DFH09DRAFT_1369154 [Mycena vulgaris]
MSTVDSSNSTTGISIGGQVYSPAQVSHFLRAAGILVAFLVFSYLALVTVPKLAARGHHYLRSVPTTGTQTSMSAPERPFAPRPRGRASAPAPRAPNTPIAHRKPHPHLDVPHSHIGAPNDHPAFPPSIAHLHRVADTVVGVHPAAQPLAARIALHPPHPHTRKVFPWVHTNAPVGFRFGLVQGGSMPPMRAVRANIGAPLRGNSTLAPLRGKNITPLRSRNSTGAIPLRKIALSPPRTNSNAPYFAHTTTSSAKKPNLNSNTTVPQPKARAAGKENANLNLNREPGASVNGYVNGELQV